jgi:hypothetical protein
MIVNVYDRNVFLTHPRATRMQPGTVDPAKHTATMADKSNDNSSLNKGPKYVQTIAQPRSYFVPAGVGAAGFLGTHMALNSLPPTYPINEFTSFLTHFFPISHRCSLSLHSSDFIKRTLGCSICWRSTSSLRCLSIPVNYTVPLYILYSIVFVPTKYTLKKKMLI